MPTQVFKTYNTAAPATADNFATKAALKAYINGLTCVASDLAPVIDMHSDLTISPNENWVPATYSATQYPTLRAAAGKGVNDLNTATLDVTPAMAGVTLNMSRGTQIVVGYGLGIVGMKIVITGGGVGEVMGFDRDLVRNRILDQSTSSSGASGLFRQVGTIPGIVTDNFVVFEGAAGKVFVYDPGGYPVRARNTIVARGAALGGCKAYSADYGGGTAVNDVFIGLGSELMTAGVAATNCFSNTTPTTGRTTGVTVNTTVGALVVSESNDFRPTPAGPLVNVATAAARNTKDILGKNRGTSPDVGAWETAPAVDLPTATVTGISIVGRKATITGTTTGTPTTSSVSTTPVAVAYNGAEAQGPVSMTLGAGTFTVEFDLLKVGRYSFGGTVSNSAGPGAIGNPIGNIEITGASGDVTSYAIDGSTLKITGTTTGSPTAVPIIVPPAATDPKGAVQVAQNAVLGAGTYSADIPLGPGRFDPAIIRFTTAAGTSFPITDSDMVQVLVEGVSGSPEAPEPEPDPGTPTATVSDVTVTPSTATGSTTFAATVNGTNSPSQAVNWSANAGSITAGGVFTAPAQTNAVQTITISATSVADPTKSGTASVTIAAAATPTPTVSGVTVNPSTANGSATFTATVNGTNSPSQAVTWSASAGSITDGGAFSAPAQTSSVQTITVTATSVADPSKSGAATVTIAATAPGAPKTATVKLVDTEGTPTTALNGLKWAWFDQVTPNLFGEPTHKGSAESTDAQGEMTIELPNSSLASGQVGWLIVTDSNGTTSMIHKAFSGPVEVN